MSYDIYLHKGNSNTTPEDIRAFLGNRPNMQMLETGADYVNENTNVGFAIDFHDGNDEPMVSVSVNYSRPTAFILEAAIEVAALIDHFGLIGKDPQTSAEYTAPMRQEDLIASYQTIATRTAKSSLQRARQEEVIVLSGIGPDSPRMPRERLNWIWQWNYKVKKRREMAKKDDIFGFTPKVTFVKHDGHVYTAITWGSGMAIVLPKDTERIMIMSDDNTSMDFLTREEFLEIYGRFFKPGPFDDGDLITDEMQAYDLEDAYYEAWKDELRPFSTDQPGRRPDSVVEFYEIMDAEFYDEGPDTTPKDAPKKRSGLGSLFNIFKR